MPDRTHEDLAAEAAAYLRESAGAVEGLDGIQPEIRKQGNFLIEWATQRGVLLNDSFLAGLEKYDRDTREHNVYFGSPGERVIKCTKPGRFGLAHGSNGKYGNHCAATPLFYLERIKLMNQEFPSNVRLEGMSLGKSEFAAEKDLQPYMVVSQNFIEAADDNHQHPSEREIEHFMLGLGFRLLEDSYYNWIREPDGIVVTDAKMLNFIISHAGIVPIDVIISRQKPKRYLSQLIPPYTQLL
jgi:hypothetical protein